jgi:hypothetical protein
MVPGVYKYERQAEAQANVGVDMWRETCDWQIFVIDLEESGQTEWHGERPKTFENFYGEDKG